MSEVDAVLTAFLSLAGLDEGEKERWRGLCASAWNDLLAHLREGISPSQQGERLTQGAAAIAYYKYALLRRRWGATASKRGSFRSPAMGTACCGQPEPSGTTPSSPLPTWRTSPPKSFLR